MQQRARLFSYDSAEKSVVFILSKLIHTL